tara:strand:+ start:350 stop:787 length:438 start_codon:yes stop_codon:yes gene_type:complete
MSKYGVGLRSVGSYQVAGVPWISGSTIQGDLTYNTATAGEMKLEFPYVTKSIMVTRTGGTSTSPGSGDLRIHFREEAADGNPITGLHYHSVTGTGGTITMDVKCKEIYLSISVATTDTTTFEVYAELTNIPTGSMFVLTGSGITD